MVCIAQWDTDNFGIKVGNLYFDEDISKERIQYEVNQAKEEGYELLYLKGVELPDEYLNENLILADEKVIYTQVINGSYHPIADVVSIFNFDLTENLLNLAYESGKYSRYKIDSNLPSEVFDTLYRIWMRDSLNGKIATDVLSFMVDGKPQSILTYKKEGNEIEIGLVAVDESQAGKGVGTKMMQSFFAMLPQGTVVEVATQKRNRVACHYYEKNGFSVKSVTNIYHIWIR